MGNSYQLPETDLTGKVAIVTGANTGLGYVSVVELARRKAHVILACRDRAKGEAALARAKQEAKSDTMELMELNLSSLESVRKFAKDFLSKNLPLHILLLNAGVLNPTEVKTEEGFETQFGVNHLAHFLLTNLLLDVLKKSAPSRVVVVSSDMHLLVRSWDWNDLNSSKYDGKMKGYSRSKLANLWFTYELARRLENTKVTVNAAHPGIVATEATRNVKGITKTVTSMVSKKPEKGVLTQLMLCFDPKVEGTSGKYWANCKEKKSSALSRNEKYAKELWEKSAEMTNLSQSLQQEPKAEETHSNKEEIKKEEREHETISQDSSKTVPEITL